MADEVLPAEVVSPEKIASGHFSLYLTADGRVVVAARIDGKEEALRWVVPKILLRTLGRSAGVEVVSALRSIKDA